MRGGTARRTEALLRELRDQSTLRLHWHLVSYGKFMTTSADWLPFSNDSASTSTTSPQDGSLFRQALVSGRFRACDVVVVLVGSQDDIEDTTTTVSNIVQIACAAARLGKHVLVGHIPTFANVGTQKMDAGHARARALKSAIDALQQEDLGTGSVTLGADSQKIVSRGGDVLYTERGFTTLNNMGYRAFARELHDDLVPLAKRVEWKHWKGMLRKNE